MKGMVIYIEMEGYLRQWLKHSLGDPVKFPNKSFENELLIRHLTTPKSEPPHSKTPQSIGIIIPDSSFKPSEHYNYLGRRGRTALIAAIENLFRITLWHDCLPLFCQPKGNVNKGIEDWCNNHGIDMDYHEAVRQKLYRMRKSFKTHGIILAKFYKKDYHDTGKK